MGGSGGMPVNPESIYADGALGSAGPTAWAAERVQVPRGVRAPLRALRALRLRGVACRAVAGRGCRARPVGRTMPPLRDIGGEHLAATM